MSDIQAFGKVKIERLTRYSGTDLDDLCEATESAIAAGAATPSTRWSRASSCPVIIIISASTNPLPGALPDRAAVILYPAIDLKGGACVRLVRGEMASATVFNTEPAAQARHFAEAGFSWLHVVDLDGAFAGHSVNGEAVRAIRQAIDLKIQLGGGIRDRAAIDNWLELGIDRVVLGTAALRDPTLVREAAAAYPGRVAVAIDARDGHVAVEGWAETSDIGAIALARRFADAGVAALVYTDIGRDGALTGVDAAAIAGFARFAGLPVIASGGVAGLADIAALREYEKDGIAGVICGRALYDGRLDARAALRLVAEGARGASAC